MPRPVVIAIIVFIAAAVGLTGWTARDDDAGNFSQYPGFAEHFAAYPPSDDLPGPLVRALLERHKPKFYLPDGHAGPVDFYRDYIDHGVLTDADGNMISDQVTADILNRHKNDLGVVFTHRPWSRKHTTSPVIFGRFETAPVDLGDGPKTFRFLTYHAVFPHSGLPAGLLGWQTIALALLGDLDDWHQLDHYTAVTVVLDDADEPIGLIVQHHNYHRTHLFGEVMPFPADGRPAIDVAIRSNELYPHVPGRTNRRAVSFLNRKAWIYMIGAGPRLMLTADDITEPVRELDYRLRFLAPSDAFYTFKGYLGERRWLMGRSGPPGANYKTLPEYLPYEIQLRAGYWRDGSARDIVALKRALQKPNYHMEFADAQGAVFRANLLCVKRWRADCAFQ